MPKILVKAKGNICQPKMTVSEDFICLPCNGQKTPPGNEEKLKLSIKD